MRRSLSRLMLLPKTQLPESYFILLYYFIIYFFLNSMPLRHLFVVCRTSLAERPLNFNQSNIFAYEYDLAFGAVWRQSRRRIFEI